MIASSVAIRMSQQVAMPTPPPTQKPPILAMVGFGQLTSRSLPEIGRRFGGRDHTTVMHGVKRIEELKQQDGQIAEDIELLRRALEA